MTDDELLARAGAARMFAYAPYSRFTVGATVLTDGKAFDGANFENASYGLSICAERNAVARAVFAGARRIERIAILSQGTPPTVPCGMCLQTLLEFAPEPGELRILLANTRGERRSFTLAELLPHGFRPGDLLTTVE